MRSSWWGPNWIELVSYKKKKKDMPKISLSLPAHAEENPCEDIMRRCHLQERKESTAGNLILDLASRTVRKDISVV